jgi:hypothetical protein
MATGGRSHDSRQHSREHRFTRTAFTDDGDDLPRDQIEADVIDRSHDALGVAQLARRSNREVLREVTSRELHRCRG